MKKIFATLCVVLYTCVQTTTAQSTVCDSISVAGTLLDGSTLYITVYNSSEHFIVYPYFTATLEENPYITMNDNVSVPSFLSTPSDANQGFTVAAYFLSVAAANEVPMNTLFEGTVTITDPNDASFSCAYDYSFTYGDLINSIEENLDDNVVIYPNPADEFIMVNNSQSATTAEYMIHDFTGRLIRRQQLPTSSTMNFIDLSNLAEGNYAFTFISGDAVKTKALVIR